MKTTNLKIGDLYQLKSSHKFLWVWSSKNLDKHVGNEREIKPGDIFLFFKAQKFFWEHYSYLPEKFFVFLNKNGKELWLDENDLKFIEEAKEQ